mmetsp:Transcript_9293/g.26715  ORF Transcript_9293/g.26715 Transcript_9293/m.26715 type:complete len:91 (+) Transcript_9293:2223-2495(+)
MWTSLIFRPANDFSSLVGVQADGAFRYWERPKSLTVFPLIIKRSFLDCFIYRWSSVLIKHHFLEEKKLLCILSPLGSVDFFDILMVVRCH